MERMSLEDRRGQSTKIVELKVALLAGESRASAIFLAPHASKRARKVQLDEPMLRVMVQTHDSLA